MYEYVASFNLFVSTTYVYGIRERLNFSEENSFRWGGCFVWGQT